MSIPTYDALMLPVLAFAGEGKFKKQEAVEKIGKQLKLSEIQLAQLLPSGLETSFSNRIGWATTFLLKAGLIERVERAVYAITSEGKKLLSEKPAKIDNALLMRYPSFVEFKTRGNASKEGEVISEPTPINAEISSTPDERIGSAYQELYNSLRQEVLERVRQLSPLGFEKLIINLMLAMGYGSGGSGQHLGKSNDGGVDGIIHEDALGLDVVYLQAKRYQEGNGISVESLRAFAGSLDEHNATKGVFVTTSHFTMQAKNYSSSKRLVLIDGVELAGLMIQYGVGVRNYHTYTLKKLDSDMFDTLDGN